MNSMDVDESCEMDDVLSDIVTDKRGGGVVDDKNTAKKTLSSMERLSDASLI